MSESCWGLVVVGDEGTLDWCAGLPVAPDRGGEGQEPDGGAGVDPGEGAPAVLFEGELPLRVSMIVSIHWRQRASLPNRAGSSLRGGSRARPG
jgi:hypothetical protein